MNHISALLTTSILTLLLTACGGGSTSVGIGTGGGSGGGGGTTQPAAPAGVYTGTTTDTSQVQYLVVLVPDGSGRQLTYWWYTEPGYLLGSDKLAGLVNGFLVPRGNDDTGTFDDATLTDFALGAVPGSNSSAGVSNATYASGDIMGILGTASLTHLYGQASLPDLSLPQLVDTYTGTLTGYNTGTTTGVSISIQASTDDTGGFTATVSGCTFSGALSKAGVNSVFFVTGISDSNKCLGNDSTPFADAGVAVKYNGHFYLSIVGSHSTAAVFSGL